LLDKVGFKDGFELGAAEVEMHLALQMVELRWMEMHLAQTKACLTT